MTKFEKLKNYSELAWAAYADYISSGENGDISTTGLQIYNFRQNFELIIEESSRENSGFQAKIFKNRNTGEYILSIRGTEISLETYKDLIIADIGGLGTDSIPRSQYADMVKFVNDNKELLKGATVVGHSLGGTLAKTAAKSFPIIY